MWDAVIRPIREHLPLWLMLLPILSAVFVSMTRQTTEKAVRRAWQVHWLLSAVFCIWLVVAYEPLKPAGSRQEAALLGPLERFQFRDRFAWVGETRSALFERSNRRGERRVIEVPAQWGPDIRFAIGVDGISVWFVVLSMLLVAVGANSEFGIRNSESANVSVPTSDFRLPTPPFAWLWLQSSLVGTFVALDVVLFVLCWMSTLLCIAVLMGRNGDWRRHEVTPRLLKAGWLGGWLVALGLGGLVLAFGWLRSSPDQPNPPLVFAIPELVAGIGQWTTTGEKVFLWGAINVWLFWLLAVGFTWPLGLAPLHRGFVESFASAPRGVALVMAGVLLKVGVYGWLRFIVPVFPDLLKQRAENFTTLAGLSSLFVAALAFGERDWNRRIALATCSSVGLSLMGAMTLTLEGLTGGVLRVLSHGLTVGLLVWMLPRGSDEWRVASGEQDNAQSLPHPSPLVSTRWLVRFSLFAWIGLPGLSGFTAEFVTPFGLFQHEFNAAALSLMTSGLIAWMWVRADRERLDGAWRSWSNRDTFVATLLVVLNIALGVAPQWVVSRIQPSLLPLVPLNQVTSVSEGR